ncbi:uncharacterized protein LOC117304047 [Asterias rubens]|uniref:uncharacterized protein LOC117304047 n=1 Tax=Asterias rubens TaxID=7604 RepID=UPI001454F230|nr:uncharacterized protein LOC117304047 [Asterias rubens]
MTGGLRLWFQNVVRLRKWAIEKIKNKIVPAAIQEFWLIWGHELLKPLIFPVAKATWDSEDHDDSSARISWKTLFNPHWRTSDKTNSNPQKKRKVMKGVIQEVVKRLKGQIAQVTSKEPVKARPSLCRCDFCCRHTTPISSTGNA